MTHFVLLLFAGDYRDASARKAAGLPDRYRHHGYALDSLGEIRDQGARVTVVQVRSEDRYDETGADGIRYVGLGPGGADGSAGVIADYLRAESATHVMLRFPSPEVLEQIVALPLRISVVLADSFPSRLRHWVHDRRRHRRLGRALADPRVDLVADHQLNSSGQVVDVLGVDPGKVVAWDWPLDLLDLAARSARTRPAGERLRLMYVGTVSPSKGVWDLLEALAALRAEGLDAGLDLAGAGQVPTMWEVADQLSVRDHVTYHGRVGGDEVLRLMQEAAFVCVPSRHGYPEGLPLTLYEAMASGTPLVASDHPMFAGVVRDGETGFVFPAGKAKRLAAAVRRGWDDPEAYAHVSATAAASYPALGLTTLWGELAVRWVRGAPDDLVWIDERSLARMPAAAGQGRGDRR